MAATYHSGSGGSIKIGVTPIILPIVNWSGKHAIDTYETTNALSAGWKERGTQNADFTGTATVVYDSTGVIPTVDFAVGASLDCKFMKGSSTKYISCTVILKSHSWKVSPRNAAAVEVDIEWESTGAITHG